MEFTFLPIFGILCICSVTSALYTHAQALALIQGSGITISPPGVCNLKSNRLCTSLDQVREVTIAGILALRSASGCNIAITDGTEVGRPTGTYSHGNGYQLNIATNACITNFIMKNYMYVGQRADGAALFRTVSGNVYAMEPTGWNLLFFSD